MPGLTQRNNAQFSNASSPLYSFSCSAGSVSANGIWSKHRDHVTFDQLEKFWSELSPEARQRLLRIDKQTLFEQARKSLYCSRCNGLLLEALSQVVMYGKSLQQEGTVGYLPRSRLDVSNYQYDSGSNLMPLSFQDDIQDPSVHPWGGLAATRGGILTLLDCFLNAKSLKALQNVFDCARARERERELLYPDACGGGGRGWISQGMAGYGRGHGTRETCALHNARLSCDTLVDFWSALGDETRQSLMRMKEEDFIERLMYRFDSKRFCRDCRRNVIREFKELKELKRMRREPRCTSWFCVADTAFQYEISDDTIQADWHQSFPDTVGTYHHFEWAVGTGEGKSDILEFENVGMNGSVEVNGLDLDGLSACFITLWAWKLDGRCTEFSVKAHALKGQQCVHRRLIVGDGYVTITKGESIRRFFEHAEEAEEEEDDDSMDKDGNDLDGEGSRPQKHAKSPELAREFLLDAATVIFKEQVEKAFREGTARQNAHSIFVCLALRLLEERVHVACKEIITLEKQIKLLEEEDKEKREDKERKERKRTKEREKKLRRKERLKGKEKEREKRCIELEQVPVVHEIPLEDLSPSVNEELSNNTSSGDSISETGDTIQSKHHFSDVQDEQFSNGYILDRDLSVRDENDSFNIEESKIFRRKLRFRKGFPPDTAFNKRRPAVVNDNGVMVNKSESRGCGGYMTTPSRCINGVNCQPIGNFSKTNSRNYGPKLGEKLYCSNIRMRDRSDFRPCSCSQHSDYRMKDGVHDSMIRSVREMKTVNKSESTPFYRNNKYNNGGYIPDNCGVSKSKPITGNNSLSRDLLRAKKVWEPLQSRKKYPQSNLDSKVTSRLSAFKAEDCGERSGCDVDEKGSQQHGNFLNQSVEPSPCENAGSHENGSSKESGQCSLGMDKGLQNEEVGSCPISSSVLMNGTMDPIMSRASSSDNCSSFLSEGDNSTASSSTQNTELLSTSDSDDAGQQSEGRESPISVKNGFHKCLDVGVDEKHNINGKESLPSMKAAVSPVGNSKAGNSPHNPNNGGNGIKVDMGSQQYRVLPPIQNQSIHFPVFPAPSAMGYYHHNPGSWSAAAPANGLVSFRQSNPYVFASPHGYGLSANQPSPFCIQYSSRQPFATRLSIGQLPACQPVNIVNGADSKEQIKDSKRGGIHKAPLQDGHNGNSKELHPENTNFSLFHFGGPIAMATGKALNSASLRTEGIVTDLSLSSPEDPAQVVVDHTCAEKETTIEEYSLFASGNMTRFSFF